MKTFDNFYEEIISLPNLYRAYELAKKGKKSRIAVLNFEENLHENLLKLHLELLTQKYEPLPYKMFYVQDYKKRKIMAPDFRDQIVHHALFNFLEQIYEPCFIYDSYACRTEKGTHKAFIRLKKFLNKYSQSDYFIKGDISKYFYSIDQYKLKSIIQRKIKDAKSLWLIEKIIDSHCEPQITAHIENKRYCEQKKGIPIGNLTSQLFANIYLNELDYFVKHNLKVKHYIRYVDDFVILGKNYSELNGLFLKIRDFLSDSLMLKLEKSKVQINKISFGVDFCGYVAFKNYIRVRTINYQRFIKKLEEKIYLWKNKFISYKEIESSFISYQGHLLHTNSLKVLERINLKFHRAKAVLAVKRGGNWNNGANAGPFYANLNNDPTNTNNNIGFRCCRAPWQNTASLRRRSQAKIHMFLPSSPNFLEFGGAEEQTAHISLQDLNSSLFSASQRLMKTGAGIEQPSLAVIPAMNSLLEEGLDERRN